MPEQWAEFVRLHVEDGKTLKLTAKHLIYTIPCLDRIDITHNNTDHIPISIASHTDKKLVFAEKVEIGDCLQVHDVEEASSTARLVPKRVTSIGQVQQRGIYAPMTATGDLIVEGILASAYTLVENRVAQGTIVEVWAKCPSANTQLSTTDYVIKSVYNTMGQLLPATDPLERDESGNHLVGLPDGYARNESL